MNTSFSSRVTVSFDPAVDEEQQVLQAVVDAYAAARDQTVDGWTPTSMDAYIAALKPVARTVLLVILSSSPCPTADARELAGLSPRHYAEAHAALEEALLAVPQVARLPFDVVDGCFTVNERMAELAISALDRVDDEGTGQLGRTG